MSAGFVVRLRVSTQDCMGLLDCMVAAKLQHVMDDMSFSAISLLILSSLLEEKREQGIIPRRDGFEFARMMKPYHNGKSYNLKRTVTKALQEASIRGITPFVIAAPSAPSPAPAIAPARSREEMLQEYATLEESYPNITPEQDAQRKELEKFFQQY